MLWYDVLKFVSAGMWSPIKNHVHIFKSMTIYRIGVDFREEGKPEYPVRKTLKAQERSTMGTL